jgi:DNA polymerase-3 subunit epsilon
VILDLTPIVLIFPLLAEELLRAGVDFDMKNSVSVDIQTIFHKKEERTLELL